MMRAWHRTESARPRVFVSSVIEEFEAYRESARKAIEDAGGEPVLVNEDLPSSPASSRNACLDAVESSDVFVLLIGARGGWRTPSGHLVVEEEFDHARGQKLPILVFLEDVERDVEARRLAQSVSDYVDGFYRMKFRGTSELSREIVRALGPLIENQRRPKMNPDRLNIYFERPYLIADQTSLRFVLAPERQEEIVDPVRLVSEEFAERIFEIGHSKMIRLFSYQRAKEPPSAQDDFLIIEQAPGHDRRNGLQGVRLAVGEAGLIVVDSNVTGRVERDTSYSMADVMLISIEDVEAVLNTDFQFANALYQVLDPYKRHHRFLWNAMLSGVGYRTFVRNPQQQSTYPVNTSGGNQPVIAFREPRLIDRETLAQPVREVERAVVSWTRKRSGAN